MNATSGAIGAPRPGLHGFRIFGAEVKDLPNLMPSLTFVSRRNLASKRGSVVDVLGCGIGPRSPLLDESG